MHTSMKESTKQKRKKGNQGLREQWDLDLDVLDINGNGSQALPQKELLVHVFA